jgi:hypothetical protein
MVRVRPIVIASLALAACGSSSNLPVADAARDGAADATADGISDGTADGTSDVATDVGAPDATDGSYGNPDGPCVPGVPRCHSDFGYQMCEQNGTWSESHSCAGYSTNGTTSYCAEIPVEGGGASTSTSTWATCVDPACWYWLGRGALGGAITVGVCESDGTMQACGGGGTLAAATCDGVCTRVTTLDGRAVGYCAAACADGARECLGGPFFRTCVKGRWSAAAACDGQTCNPVATGSVPDVRCGGACAPGTSRCRTDLLAVEVCKPDGTWVEDRACLRGRCRPAGPQAECETQCAPGERQCAFDGAGSERVCGETGLWMAETACASDTACRLSGDVSLGCVACVGARPGGGNAFGVADQRCGASGGVQTCGADGHWQAAVACHDGARCVPMVRDVSQLAACQPL